MKPLINKFALGIGLGTALVFFLGASNAFIESDNSASDVGEIGDVKFSLLAPEEFRKCHGNGWALMMPKKLIPGEHGKIIRRAFGGQLGELTDLNDIPDARGVFIRGMNQGRPAEYTIDNEGKPDGSGAGDSDGDRLLGSFQSDVLQDHVHMQQRLTPGDDRGLNIQGGNDDGYYAHLETTEVTKTGKHAARAGKETRPRNIAVYIYVKVTTESFYEKIKD